jgi:polysaccharide export outer membrane protein
VERAHGGREEDVKRRSRLRIFAFSAAIAILQGIGGVATPAQDQAAVPIATEDYVLGVEDKLNISVWKEPDLVRSLSIRPDGKITFPLVGDIQAAGRTPKQLTDELAKSLERYIKEPVVTVAVEEINNFRVFVLGEVATQGVLTLRRRTRLLEAIALAGGLSQFADKSNVVLMRIEGTKEVRTRIDYRKVVSGDRPELNVSLKPGDIIVVN